MGEESRRIKERQQAREEAANRWGKGEVPARMVGCPF